MAKAKPGSIADELRGFLPSKRRATWEHRLPADVREELEAVRADFYAGKIDASRTGLAHALSKTLTARGLSVCPHTVARWLEAK
jgi:hypothetical protein